MMQNWFLTKGNLPVILCAPLESPACTLPKKEDAWRSFVERRLKFLCFLYSYSTFGSLQILVHTYCVHTHSGDDLHYAIKTIKKNTIQWKKNPNTKPPKTKHISSVLKFLIKHYMSWLNGSVQSSECIKTVREQWVQHRWEMHLQRAWKYWTSQKKQVVHVGANEDQGDPLFGGNRSQTDLSEISFWEQKIFQNKSMQWIVKNHKDYLPF